MHGDPGRDARVDRAGGAELGDGVRRLGGGPGLVVNPRAGTVTVSLAQLPQFKGIVVVGTGATDRITLGPQGVNLAALTAGAASQSLAISTGTEDKIQASRRFYNMNVRDLNIKVQSVPSNIIANLANIGEREFFEIEDPTEKNVPDVSFDASSFAAAPTAAPAAAPAPTAPTQPAAPAPEATPPSTPPPAAPPEGSDPPGPPTA